MNIEELKKPFPVNAISWRVGQKSKTKPKAMMLCYIDARDVMDRLDEVCGSNWSDDYKEVKGRIVCTITIDGVSRSDGAGDTDFEGEKGGLSDAFKRAAVKWGIGRYLYNASEYNTWIDTKDAEGKDIPDYDLLKYAPNKEKLDKVARMLSGTEKTPTQKAAETRQKNKETKEEYLKQYEAWMGWFAKHTGEITTKSIMAVELTIMGLQNFSLKQEANTLRDLLDKAKNDKIPDFQPVDYLQAG